MMVRRWCGWPTGRPRRSRSRCARARTSGSACSTCARPARSATLSTSTRCAAGGEDEQRLHVALVGRRDEDEAVGDLGGGDAEGLGGGLRGAHGIGQVAHLGGDVVQREGVQDRPHAGVAGEVAQRHRVARLGVHAIQRSDPAGRGLTGGSVRHRVMVVVVRRTRCSTAGRSSRHHAGRPRPGRPTTAAGRCPWCVVTTSRSPSGRDDGPARLRLARPPLHRVRRPRLVAGAAGLVARGRRPPGRARHAEPAAPGLAGRGPPALRGRRGVRPRPRRRPLAPPASPRLRRPR